MVSTEEKDEGCFWFGLAQAQAEGGCFVSREWPVAPANRAGNFQRTGRAALLRSGKNAAPAESQTPAQTDYELGQRPIDSARCAGASDGNPGRCLGIFTYKTWQGRTSNTRLRRSQAPPRRCAQASASPKRVQRPTSNQLAAGLTSSGRGGSGRTNRRARPYRAPGCPSRGRHRV